MKLMLDTNILIDHLAQRQPNAKAVQKLCIASYFGDVELWASVQSFLDALYCLRRFASQEELRQAALGTLEFIKPCGIRAQDLVPALKSGWPDVEDFIIFCCAQNISADYLITRDVQGFCESKIKTATPEDIVTKLQLEGVSYDMCALLQFASQL